jgi:hypothetical protein
MIETKFTGAFAENRSWPQAHSPSGEMVTVVGKSSTWAANDGICRGVEPQCAVRDAARDGDVVGLLVGRDRNVVGPSMSAGVHRDDALNWSLPPGRGEAR